MGSGLSMTSVNKIKELASSKEYSLALDIVKNQDLSKSLNPQFLRLCGEIYLVNGCYNEAREVLLMAHKMAPEGKRIIYFLVDLYLRMGFKELAKTYYELYLFDADESGDETKQLKYIYAKSQRLSVEELESYIISKYVNNMDYDWSFEAYLLLKIKNETEKVNILIEEYKATFKNSDNVLLIDDIEEGRKSVEECYYVYSEVEKADDDEQHETLRKQEQILLEQDDIRIHPREPEITIMIDDRDEPEIGSKFRLKRFLKEQKKLEEKLEKEKLEQENSKDEVKETSEQTEDEANNNENVTVEAKEKPVTDEQVNTKSDLDGEEQDSEESGNKVFSSLKKIFKKKKKEEEEKEKTETSVEIQDENTEDKNTVKSEETTGEQTENLADKQDGEKTETATDKQDEEQTETATDKQDEEQTETASDKQDEEQTETASDKQDEEQTETVADKQDDNFNTKSKTMKFVFEDAVVVDEESELEVDDFSSVYDDEFGEMNAADEDNLEQNDDLTKDAIEEFTEEIEEEAVEEAVEEATEEIEEETVEEAVEEATEEIEEEAVEEAVEEFTEEIEEEAVEEVVEEFTEEIKEEAVEESTEEIEEEAVEEVTEEIKEEAVEESTEEIEEETVEEAVEETTEEIKEEVVEESTEEVVEETTEEIEEKTDDTEDLVEDEYVEIDEAKDALAEFENTYEGAEESNDIEEIDQEVWEEEKEEVPETFSEETDEIEEEKNWDCSFENQEDDSETCIEETEQVSEEEGDQNKASENEVDLYDEEEFHKQWEEKNKRINFPVFKTSLFPTYNSETVEVENNFNEVMSDAQDKMHDNLLKEEQMQKEAEALLASLGIDINGVTTSDEKTVVSNKGPSRDEIKASLKIDSVKKNILIKLKDYR